MYTSVNFTSQIRWAEGVSYIGICLPHCNIRLRAPHNNKGLCLSHCDIWKYLSHVDVRICMYITLRCYGSSNSDDGSMCVTLRR
jgi:hypothetical protein